MKNFKLVPKLMTILGIWVVISVISCEKEALKDIEPTTKPKQEQNVIGERIINNYIQQNHSSLDPAIQEKGSVAYLNFLFDINMGDYPDLTGKKSVYLTSMEELDAVIEFIMEERAHLYNDYPADAIQDEPEARASEGELPNVSGRASYNRTRAKDYALRWAFGRNSSYPDFSTAGGGGDCTNFVSQAVHAGGIAMHGSGDGCKHEVTNAEWYVHSGGGWSCFGSWSNWEWSTPWAATWPFRAYHAYNASNATVPGWTRSASTADAHLNIGDVVQLQRLSNGSWSTFHTMIVTEDIYRDLKVTYHTSDTKNKKLSAIVLGSNQRFMLVKF